MSRAIAFLTRRRGGKGWHWTDIFTWVWLISGIIIMFGPALWLVASSFKTPAALAEFPPHHSALHHPGSACEGL